MHFDHATPLQLFKNHGGHDQVLFGDFFWENAAKTEFYEELKAMKDSYTSQDGEDEMKAYSKLELSVYPNTKTYARTHIIPYDITKRKWTSKINRTVATTIVNSITKKINKTTRIVGLENLDSFDGGSAIITCNHFSPVDSTIVRYLTNRIGKKRQLSIVVAESNVFMKGKLGWLLKKCQYNAI